MPMNVSPETAEQVLWKKLKPLKDIVFLIGMQVQMHQDRTLLMNLIHFASKMQKKQPSLRLYHS